MSSISDTLLRAILQTVARQTFAPSQLAELVLPPGAGPSQQRAFNMCDGTKTQADIAKEAGIDPGNFSRTVGRWIENGVMFRLGEGREARLLHCYPLPASVVQKERAR